MYIPKFFEENDVSTLHELIESNPLGMWSSIVNGAIEINHIPFLLQKDRGELGTLVGHVAKSNAIWQNFSKGADSVVVFQGEQAYITPSWYPSKNEHGKAVPTWNYTVVHASGMPKMIDDPQWLLNHVNELTNIHESQQKQPWKVSDAPSDFIGKLVKAIVGIEIPISKISGKWKLSQNRSESDKLGVIAGLSSNDDAQAQALAHKLNQRLQSKS